MMQVGSRQDATEDPVLKKVHELMALEYEYLTNQLLSNEEMGEKRVALFVSLTAGLGAAAVLAPEKLNEAAVTFPEVFLAVSVAWLLFGYLTLLRIIYRNLATDKLKGQLNLLRQWFVDPGNEPALQLLPYHPYKEPDARNGLKFFDGRGGYAELVALINALIAAAIAWQAVHHAFGPGAWVKHVAIAGAIIVALYGWFWQATRAATIYAGKRVTRT